MAAPDPRVGRLKRRPEFLAVAGTRRKHVAPGLILQVRRHDERQRPAPGEPPIRLGLTASRKVGNAVVRNRARRRLREAARQILTAHAAPGHDFVLVARAATAERPWTELVGDLIAALKRLGLWRDVSKSEAPKNEVNGGPNAVTSNGGTGNGSGGGEVGA
ncbi:ribonuclease P [Azospirillum argentinense]|uniref:Ribonuclease P protein component n=1 Tax=Azospirillum argentinense TaxID=2970906 RepID=A0A060D9E0_9PROT|nr:ribonuclease P protein component [Azospirillum argentinense]AIB10696.1 ribonuclease P [Azospirillum argentinense]EZQ07675.1 ribonuclease P [Azospirillum argentinense]KAA1057957.1 Ribonuclease P protein component [Azospirillum argentinense]MBK3802403.1 ribonuclease P protein component [Azospirillum argentinense]PNQ98904.1 ribonuclease P protein component [Azospirillum argentinense]